jgi:replication initiation protein RepC
VIASAGGYLRELTRKAEANAFSVGPMLMALVSARNRERKRA